MRYAEPLLLRPDPDAPVVGQVARREDVTITAVSAGYALVQTDDGMSGYTRLADVREAGSYRPVYVPPSEQLRPPPRAAETAASASASTPPASTASVRQLDGSNAASRDAFAENVTVTQSAVSNGFQLAT
jgi:hypothetical protein